MRQPMAQLLVRTTHACQIRAYKVRHAKCVPGGGARRKEDEAGGLDGRSEGVAKRAWHAVRQACRHDAVMM